MFSVIRRFLGYPYVYPHEIPSGVVRIERVAKDAMVYVDGIYVGVAGQLQKFWLLPGKHDIELRDASGHTLRPPTERGKRKRRRQQGRDENAPETKTIEYPSKPLMSLARQSFFEDSLFTSLSEIVSQVSAQGSAHGCHGSVVRP